MVAGSSDRADDRRVDQERDGDAEAHLLEHDQVAAREAAKTATMISAAPVISRAVEADAVRDGVRRSSRARRSAP